MNHPAPFTEDEQPRISAFACFAFGMLIAAILVVSSGITEGVV